MKSLNRAIMVSLAVILSGYFIWYTATVFQGQDFGIIANIHVMMAIIIAALLYALVIPISGFAWSQLLKAFDDNWSYWLLTSILATTQLAKYIPGNIAQHIGRASLSIKYGMTLELYLSSILIETALAAVASIIVGASFLLVEPIVFDKVVSHYQESIVAILFVLLAGGLFYNKVVTIIYSELAKRDISLSGIEKKGLGLVLFLYCTNYLIIGLGLWLVAYAMGISSDLNYPLITAAFSLAWFLGFLAPGAPAGFGVREAVLIFILSGSSPETKVLAFILATRLVTLIGDAISFMIGSLSLVRRKSKDVS